ncbi:LPS assembly lipoprotein LptE [Limimaricola variabilis]|uniref:LPS assembly lipoprotein LptE n=1 Tax=Limimaricola variabilis TaxID=1492771 RepID=UPI002AC93046|nr:LPS assembly lipoprotein LptE [Limimaricola variabilis]WPY93536.1 LPS assembly lipoprotein LptE [Limimaricola variabilis]
MWSSESSRRAWLLGALALGGCGFTPAYGPGGAAPLRGTMAVETPATFPGYLLRARLLDRLGPAERPRYLLDIDVTEETEQAAISADGAVLRYRLLGAALYALRPVAGGDALAEGTVEDIASYSTTLGTVASEAAERDARERLAVLLADQIVTRLLAVPARP